MGASTGALRTEYVASMLLISRISYSETALRGILNSTPFVLESSKLL